MGDLKSTQDLTSSDWKTQIAAMMVTQQYTASTVSDIKTELHQTQSSISQILVRLAEMPALYIGKEAHAQVLNRLEALEKVSAETVPKFSDLIQDVAALTQKVSNLASERDRQTGGMMWLQHAILIGFTVANLLLASKGKLW